MHFDELKYEKLQKMYIVQFTLKCILRKPHSEPPPFLMKQMSYFLNAKVAVQQTIKSMC